MLDEIAKGLASHKLIPFLGAGVSAPQLRVDWNGIVGDMASQLSMAFGGTPDELQDIPQRYWDTRGPGAFAENLRRHLIRTSFDDSTGGVHLQMLTLHIGTVYTTNQDNLFELCSKKYGRPYRRVVTLEDLASLHPRDFALVKYHGDLDVPSSVVFTRESYDRRIADVDHFLNIRMRADVLGKGFMFVGYSFRDPNIRLLFQQLNAAFKGKMPKSYFVAYRYDPAMDSLLTDYGIDLIDPMALFPHAASADEAFQATISALHEKTVGFKTAQEISSIFEPSVPSPQRTITVFELSALSKRLGTTDLAADIQLFRALLDATLIPTDLQGTVAQLFGELVDRCSTEDESNALSASLFNLRLDADRSLDALAAVMTTARHRSEEAILNLYLPRAHGVPEAALPIACARSLELMDRSGIKANTAFWSHAKNWLRWYPDLPDVLKGYVKSQVDKHWRASGTGDNPLERAETLARSGLSSPPSFEKILANLKAVIPTRPGKPST